MFPCLNILNLSIGRNLWPVIQKSQRLYKIVLCVCKCVLIMWLNQVIGAYCTVDIFPNWYDLTIYIIKKSENNFKVIFKRKTNQKKSIIFFIFMHIKAFLLCVCQFVFVFNLFIYYFFKLRKSQLNCCIIL